MILLNNEAPRQGAQARRQEKRTKARLAALLRTLAARGWKAGAAAGWDEQQAHQWYARLVATRLKDATLPLAAVSLELLHAHKPDTVRGNMYLVVSAGWLPDTDDKSYDAIQRLLVYLRKAGVIPMAPPAGPWIVDNVRGTIKPSSWSGLDDYAEVIAHAYRLNFWSRLPEYVEVIVEKDTVAGKLSAVTRQFDVPLHPIRGYSSLSFAFDIAQGLNRVQKPVTIYYYGDHDPSGRNLEDDVRDGLTEYCRRPFRWKRLGFNPEHFAAYNARPLAPKKKDSRTAKFIERWGRDCAEVEAVPAPELRRMLREAIESHIPAGEWARLQRVEAIERQQCRDYIDNMFRPRAAGDEGGHDDA